MKGGETVKRLTENARNHLGTVLTIRWGTSRARGYEGYTTCTLRNGTGRRVAACSGGGYDMTGTVFGNWIARTFAAELRSLRAKDMPAQSHWEASHQRVCQKCLIQTVADEQPYESLPPETHTCPVCGDETREDHHDGKRVDDGRSFYGLTYHDPNYNPGKAVIGKDCHDRTLGKSEGETVEQAEAAGKSVGLERYQAFYRASSPVPSKRHIVPLIDGACGFNSVLSIFNAIGLSVRKVGKSGNVESWEVVAAKRPRKSA
jgi:hypothetical protein